MIHFYLSFGHDAEGSPFAIELRRLGVSYRILPSLGGFSYRHRAVLLFWLLPRLVLRAWTSAWRSMGPGSQAPDHVVICSHLEAMAFACMRFVLRRRTRIHLLGFIYTRRRNALLDRWRRRYFDALLSRIDTVLCHSKLEVARYDDLFPSAAGRFAYVPLGLHIHGFEAEHAEVPVAQGAVFSAGRSGRDYATLTAALAGGPFAVRIACDDASALTGATPAGNIEILRACYGDAYVHELRSAGAIVVALSVDDISAGQMVLLQGMAFRKPIICTRTPTIADYLQHEVTALLVPPADPLALRAAVDRLRADPALARSLAENAHCAYVQQHSMASMVRHITRVIGVWQPADA